MQKSLILVPVSVRKLQLAESDFTIVFDSKPDPNPGPLEPATDFTFLDIAGFVQALSSGTFDQRFDLNGDGVVNFLDISLFVQALSTPETPTAPKDCAILRSGNSPLTSDSGSFSIGSKVTLSNGVQDATGLFSDRQVLCRNHAINFRIVSGTITEIQVDSVESNSIPESCHAFFLTDDNGNQILSNPGFLVGDQLPPSIRTPEKIELYTHGAFRKLLGELLANFNDIQKESGLVTVTDNQPFSVFTFSEWSSFLSEAVDDTRNSQQAWNETRNTTFNSALRSTNGNVISASLSSSSTGGEISGVVPDGQYTIVYYNPEDGNSDLRAGQDINVSGGEF